MRMTLGKTFYNIRTDYRAIADLMGMKMNFFRVIFLFFCPSIMAITLYRFSHYFYSNKIKPLAWILWQFNIYLTGADILPNCVIGEYFYIGHSTGTVLAAKFGSNVKVFGQACIGGGMGSEDRGAGPGLPVIGDNVRIGFRSLILGPVVIGNGATIGPMTFVNKSVPENATAVGNPCKILRGPDAAGSEKAQAA